MEDFYRARRRFDVLIEGGEPVGGKWNYDHENREPPPKGRATLGVVAPWQPPEDEIDEQVRADLDALDLPTVGRDGPRWFEHADGGMLATKPCASGGAYVNRMSDHCGTWAFDPRKRLGDDACPYTAGYWASVHRHRQRLAANNRTQRAVASMRRLSDLEAVLEQESAREAF
jgi:deoxyribodipyrimidine photolyase-like uncharacterized protein